MAEKGEWGRLVKEAAAREKVREFNERRAANRRYIDILKKLVTLELLIGIIAAYSYYMLFGAQELEKTLLSWVIGLTLASTLIALTMKRYGRITRFS
jgi:hypothetical protein